MKMIFFISSTITLLLFGTGCSTTSKITKNTSSIRPEETPADSKVPITISANPVTNTSAKPGPKSFKDFFDERKIRMQAGMITVIWQDDRYYFDIPNSLLEKDFLAITRFVSAPVGARYYGGEEANNNVLRFEKGFGNKIFLRTTLNLVSSPDNAKPIYNAVKNSNINPIAAVFDIKARSKDNNGIIIDVTDFFQNDNQVVSLSSFTRGALNLTNIANDRSYIENIHSFPENTEVRTIKTYNASGSGGKALPGATVAGVVTIEMNTSFIKLPDVPMKRRFYDRRVGYLSDYDREFLDESQKVTSKSYIVRWKLEPKPEDIEKYKRGELVEPKKPIVLYIDPATPVKWRPYLIQGINDWQKALEKAGFKNAITGKIWPADSNINIGSANYSALRYFASEKENAYGNNVHDPRTGEILAGSIGWYHNIMQRLQHMYFVQAAAVDRGARKMKFDDALMGDLIRFASSHEVGHILGLGHNMGSSSKTPVEKLRDKKWLEEHGHTASVMDYARFNYVAQPEDSISHNGIFPRVGEYDEWAIEWGYRWTDKSEDEDKKEDNTLIVDRLKKNPRLWYGGESFDDPRRQSEDLSDNAMKAGEYGIRNLKRIVKKLPEWTKEEGENYENLKEMYYQVVNQFNLYSNHVLTNIGGRYQTFKSIEEDGDVYEPVPKARQKEAVKWLHEQVFQTPEWLLDKDILNKISDPMEIDTIASIQNSLLSSLLSTSRLLAMQDAEKRFTEETYNISELLTDLENGIWSELKIGSAISMGRRNLQKKYIDCLLSLLTSKYSTTFFGEIHDVKNSDIPSIVRGHLTDLLAQIDSASSNTTDKLSQYHLQDAIQRINFALNP